MTDWSDQVPFKEFSDFCEACVNEKKKDLRLRKLEKFLTSCRRRAGQQSIFPLMRFILPNMDKERGAFRIKETLLANLYITFLQLGTNSKDALLLKNFRAPKTNPDDAGDFAAVLFSVMKDRGYCSTDLTCFEVNTTLDKIVQRSEGKEGTKEVEKLLKEMFLKMAPVEQKWFVRLILKNLKFGLGPAAILSAFHPDASALLDVQASLSAVCSKLKDPKVRLHEMEVELGQPFKPQLADRIPVGKLEKLFEGREFFIETKYDGERCQVHLLPGQDRPFRCFSRNGNDFTSEYEAAGFGGLLKSCLKPEVATAILDGEICAWNKEEKCIVQKGEQMNIRGLVSSDGSRLQQCLVLYDICFLNGTVLTGKMYKERLLLLERSVSEKEGRVMFSERKKGSSAQHVVTALNEAMDRREEGLVIKDPEVPYKPGARAGAGWVKVKPEYEAELVDTLDLVIIGGYWGKGRGGGRVSHFLLGLRDGSSFLSLARVGSGYSAAELAGLVAQCKEGRNSKVMVAKEVPEVWYDPEFSPVLQVKAAEIIFSSSMAAGWTIRFPRVEKVREDKGPKDACTLGEFETLRKRCEGKLFGQTHMRTGDEGDIPPPRKRPRVERAGLSARFLAQDLHLTRVDTHRLKDQVVVVEPADEKLKAELEKEVARHGGTVEQNVRPGITTIYVHTGMTLKGRLVAQRGQVDVVRPSWLTGGLPELPPAPHNTEAPTQATREAWEETYDDWQDSLTQPATRESLEHSMALVERQGGRVKVSKRMRAEIEEEAGGSKILALRGAVIAFVKRKDEYHGDKEEESSLEEIEARFHGAEVVDNIGDIRLTHVVVLGGDLFKEEEASEAKRERSRRLLEGEKIFHLVSSAWLDDSIRENRILGEGEYAL